MSFEKNDHLGLSSIQTTVHLGAHTDAPNHYSPKGDGIESRDLSFYFGPCTVVEVPFTAKGRIAIDDFSSENLRERVLFKTNSFPDPNHWTNEFMAFEPELIDFLAAKGVRLIGIDTPSVDLADDKELLAHNRIAANDMAILEGIVLEHIKPGNYILSALPLRLKDADASPVRAVLLEMQS